MIGSARAWLVLAIAAGLAVRVVLVAAVMATDSVEVFEYDTLARNVANGHGYVFRHMGTDYHAFYSGIAYVGMLAGLYHVIAPAYVTAAILLLQALFSAGLTVLVWRIAGELGDGRTAIVAAFLTSLHPGILYYDTHKIHPLSFDALTIAAASAALLAARHRRSLAMTALAGVALGVATLQRGPMIALIPLGALWLGWPWRDPRRAALRAACYVACALAVLAPWAVRNYVVLDRLVLNSTAGESFWRGNAAHSLGATYITPGQTVLEAVPQFQQSLRAKDEMTQDAMFWRAATNDIREDPPRFVVGVWAKIFAFWSVGPDSGPLYPRLYVWSYGAYYVPLAALAILALVRLIRRGPAPTLEAAALLVIVMLGVTVMQSLFYVEARHRWGVEPLLLAFSALALTQRRAERPREPSARARRS